ncbi:MAG: phage holin [Liquorilactobacillus nagelii]|jgi:LL-H family phage holin|uniref:phage holin n=1 Tax=Liquorilactobacillus nagelii TaxID=82688 RepID=UPI00242D6B2A|nr:phage holin [Liquorilactobacillus nagelii]MCI1922326.1 phage holin [Liquorilactobacillus nagelii]
MNVQNISDLVIAIAAAAVPVVFAYITKFFKDNKQAMSILDAVSPLAKDAVVAAEKLGVDKYIEGAVKKSKAVEYVMNGLTALGFDKADLTVIENAVEKAYAEAKNTLESVYPQKTEAEEEKADAVAQAKVLADAQAKKLELAKSDLEAKQKALADAQAEVAKLTTTTTATK